MIKIDGTSLTIKDVFMVAKKGEQVSLSSKAKDQIKKSQKWVEDIAKGHKPVYGINTGFGIFANKNISPEDIQTLNRNLILSHAVGTGPDLAEEIVRASILIRANTLASGHSGIRLELVESLLDMLNINITPCIPSKGSLGSSGDLAPLSHLALVLTTSGEDLEEESGWAVFQGERGRGKVMMQKANIRRHILGPKEGLAITNGATFSAGIAALAIQQAETIIETAEVALAMTLEALQGASAAFDERLHRVRRHEGQKRVAERVRELTKESTLIDSAGKVQDPYSLRCAPQVQGPARDTLEFVKGMINREINAITDNPLLFGPYEALSGGNFHGEIIAMAMDFLKIAFSELAAISERRTFNLTDSKMNSGLPAMLVDNEKSAGLNSGMMMPQYTSASLVLENKTLATPDSVHSLPTSGGQEDHNANSMIAARHAMDVMGNCAHVIGIELYCAARALDLRMRENPGYKMGVGVEKAFNKIRLKVPYQPGDAYWGDEISHIVELVNNGSLAQ
jgi:histidine ammonia-lyase